MSETIKHTAHGREYEIRSMTTPEGILVATFFNDQRVSPKYGINWETASDFRHYHAEPAIRTLIEIAKADIDSGNILKPAAD